MGQHSRRFQLRRKLSHLWFSESQKEHHKRVRGGAPSAIYIREDGEEVEVTYANSIRKHDRAYLDYQYMGKGRYLRVKWNLDKHNTAGD